MRNYIKVFVMGVKLSEGKLFFFDDDIPVEAATARMLAETYAASLGSTPDVRVSVWRAKRDERGLVVPSLLELPQIRGEYRVT